jgi:glycosyltransferase involved in cell wall biosynthesis
LINSNLPLISIIVPCFNGELYLKEALDSIFIQKISSIEVIVIDDGSMDKSSDIAFAYPEKIVYCFQNNEGIASARNKGLTLARGKYIGFLDADDIWLSDTLTSFSEYLEIHTNVDGVFGKVQNFISPELNEKDRSRLINAVKILPARLNGATFFRASAFQKVGMYNINLKVGSEIDWYLRAESLAINFAEIDKVVLKRRLHLTNYSHKKLYSGYLNAIRTSIYRSRSSLINKNNEY